MISSISYEQFPAGGQKVIAKTNIPFLIAAVYLLDAAIPKGRLKRALLDSASIQPDSELLEP
eukprot:746122-Hanusia_phi.AAC.3